MRPRSSSRSSMCRNRRRNLRFAPLSALSGSTPSETGQVHGHEQQVAHLLVHRLGIGGRARGRFAQLPGLLVELGLGPRGVGPVEAHARRLGRHLEGLEDGGEALRDPVEQGRILLVLALGGALGLLQGLPVAEHLARGAGLFVAEDVGMPADHLLGDPLDHAVDVKSPAFSGHVRVEDHLQQKVAQLTGQGLVVLKVDGLRDLVGFLDGHRLHARVGLLAVPGAAPGSPQPRDEPHEIHEEPARLLGRWFHAADDRRHERPGRRPGYLDRRGMRRFWPEVTSSRSTDSNPILPIL